MKDIIEKAWENRTLLNDDNTKQTIRKLLISLIKVKLELLKKLIQNGL